jgi:hypothetical protein
MKENVQDIFLYLEMSGGTPSIIGSISDCFEARLSDNTAIYMCSMNPDIMNIPDIADAEPNTAGVVS